jgi:hypothetical protein
MEPLIQESMRVCEQPGCERPATFRFGVEAGDPPNMLAYIQGEIFAGRRRYPGDAIHVCAEHAHVIYEQCHDAEIARMLRGGS